MTDHTKDPRGLVVHDVEQLKQVFKPKPYSPKDSMADIMYREGQQAVLRYIEDKIVGKR